MSYVKILLAVAAVIATCNGAAVEKRLKVDLYYESLCPGCQALITEQLVVVAEKLNDYLTINLFPFGNAQFVGNQIVCQHGPQECLGNKVHACAIERLESQLKQVQFVACMDGSPSVEDGGKQCSAQFDLKWEEIQDCANGEEGEKLHTAYGKLTLALNPTNPFVPVVAIDDYRGETSANFEDYQLNIQGDLLKAVCQKLKVKGILAPPACIPPTILLSYA